MAAISALPNIKSQMKVFVEDQYLSHKQISHLLLQRYPGTRGLSTASVRRYCQSEGIHRTSLLDDVQLDEAVFNSISEVGSAYGRKTMKGYLSSKGIRVGENRLGISLKRVDPSNHIHRATLTYFQTNPTPYTAAYFGQKVHIDQNEKMVMFGVTHIVGVDGFSGKIVGSVIMPIKNCVIIYEDLYMKMLQQHGIWDQLRLDMGNEWTLITFAQELLSGHRGNTTKPPYVCSSSKNNHTIERLWVEVNARVNYPLKRALIEMSDNGLLQIDNPLHKHCTSWFTRQVAECGMSKFIQAWNEHPLPGRKDGMPRGIPNRRVHQNNQIQAIPSSAIPSAGDIVRMYTSTTGGSITTISNFGFDPLCHDPVKCQLRSQSFTELCPSFDSIFSQTVNGNLDIFKNNLLLFIDITRRLAAS